MPVDLLSREYLNELEEPAPEPAERSPEPPWLRPAARAILMVVFSLGAIIGVILLLGHLAGASPAGGCGGG